MIRIKYQLLMLLIILISGCTYNSQSQFIKIPVTVRAKNYSKPIRPALAIANIKKNATPDQVIKAYAQSVDVLIGYSRQLEKTLEGYA